MYRAPYKTREMKMQSHASTFLSIIMMQNCLKLQSSERTPVEEWQTHGYLDKLPYYLGPRVGVSKVL